MDELPLGRLGTRMGALKRTKVTETRREVREKRANCLSSDGGLPVTNHEPMGWGHRNNSSWSGNLSKFSNPGHPRSGLYSSRNPLHHHACRSFPAVAVLVVMRSAFEFKYYQRGSLQLLLSLNAAGTRSFPHILFPALFGFASKC